MTIYRLFQARFDPWDAQGARKYGGRWNSVGREMLYASSSLALACLEVLVHIRDVYNVPQFSYCSIDVADKQISPFPFWDPRNASLFSLARGRAIIESDVLSCEFGDAFLAGEFMDVCTQEVPSVVVPAEMNYLLNPSHKLFRSLRWSEPAPFEFDPRLLDSGLR